MEEYSMADCVMDEVNRTIEKASMCLETPLSERLPYSFGTGFRPEFIRKCHKNYKKKKKLI